MAVSQNGCKESPEGQPTATDGLKGLADLLSVCNSVDTAAVSDDGNLA